MAVKEKNRPKQFCRENLKTEQSINKEDGAEVVVPISAETKQKPLTPVIVNMNMHAS